MSRMEPWKKRLSEDEKKEYLNGFCHQFQSCSYGKDGFWYLLCTSEPEKPRVLEEIRNSNRIALEEDCGDMLAIYFMEE